MSAIFYFPVNGREIDLATLWKMELQYYGKFTCNFQENVLAKNKSEIDWLVSFHPSRLKSKLAWHYNPSKWGSRRRTWPKERGE